MTHLPLPTVVSDDACALVAPYLRVMEPSAPQRYRAPGEVLPGACCRRTFDRGWPSTSRRSAGPRRAVSKRWSATCRRSCAGRSDVLRRG